MCLSLPGQVTRIDGVLAEVAKQGRRGCYNALAFPELKVGDFVLLHANPIISIISPEVASEISAAFQELEEWLNETETTKLI